MVVREELTEVAGEGGPIGGEAMIVVVFAVADVGAEAAESAAVGDRDDDIAVAVDDEDGAGEGRKDGAGAVGVGGEETGEAVEREHVAHGGKGGGEDEGGGGRREARSAATAPPRERPW